MNSIRTLQALLPMVAWAIAPCVQAGSGVIEINADCAAVGCVSGDAPGLPITLSQPGSYLLTSDLTVAALDGIAIQANAGSAIDLDLGGHSLIGPLNCLGPPNPCTPATASLSYGILLNARPGRLRNGSVRGFSDGVAFAPSAGSVLENLSVSGNRDAGIRANDLAGGADGEVVFRDLHVARNGVGINALNVFFAPRCTLDHVRVLSSYGVGVYADGLLVVLDSVIADNVGLGIDNNQQGPGELASARSLYLRNNGGAANAQFAATTTRNMGGNACSSATCFP